MRDIIIIPTYNERETIGDLVAEIFRVLPAAEIMVVDDSSPDGTGELVRQLQQDFSNLKLMVRKEKTGLGNAYKEAFNTLKHNGDIRTVTTMDADWSHNPKYLPQLLEESKRHDVVIGSRYISGGGVPRWEPWRRFLSWGGNRYARFITGVPVNDLTAGFVCFQREFLARLDFSKIPSSSYAYTIESKCHAYHAGARIKEIPIIFDERRRGQSKIASDTVRQGLLTPWRIRFRKKR